MLKNIIESKGSVEALETIKALNEFKKAYDNLLKKWYDNNILDHTESLGVYPFEKSFDELSIGKWIEKTVSEIENK